MSQGHAPAGVEGCSARYQSVSKELIEKVIKVLEANRVMKACHQPLNADNEAKFIVCALTAELEWFRKGGREAGF
jgi:hypothetical protein